MSGDLERLFSSFRTDTDAAPLPIPGTLRRRGDRRRRARRAVGVVVAAVLVGGAAAGTWQLLAESVAPVPPIAGDSPSPSASPVPSPSPSTSAQVAPAPEPTRTSAAPEPADSPVSRKGCEETVAGPYFGPKHAGTPLPGSVMLAAADWGRCYVMSADRPGYAVYEPEAYGGPEPDVCLDDAPYATDADRVAGRFRHFDGGPEIHGFQSVTRYRPGAAAEFLDEVRRRVARCATFTSEILPEDLHARIVAQGFAGDESLVIYVGTGDDGTGYPGWYIGVARRGDLVVVVWPSADLGGERAYTVSITRKAVGRL